MDWIKRNLLFVVGAAIALLLLAGAGYYTWTAWSNKSQAWADLDGKYEELKRLAALNPHPGDRKVDNIKAAREQLRVVREATGEVARHFQPIPALPEGGTNVSAQAFASRLATTILELQRNATNAGVVLLQPKYDFSFKQQNQAVRFAPGSVPLLAVQLGEVKAICDILIAAKINSLESLQRERVSADDLAGPQTDYLEARSETNDLAILTPYQVTFRSFTPELAQVLCGFAAAPYGLMVKSLNIEPSTATVMEAAATPTYTYVPVAPQYTPQYTPTIPNRPIPGEERGGFDRRFAERYGATPPPVTPTPAPVYAAPAVSTGPRTVLNERQLKVTMMLEVVKLLPKK